MLTVDTILLVSPCTLFCRIFCCLEVLNYRLSDTYYRQHFLQAVNYIIALIRDLRASGFKPFFLTKVDLQALDTYGKAHWWSHGWCLCALNVLFLQSKLKSPEAWFADMWHQPLTIYIIFLENFQSLSKFKVKIRPVRILANLHMTFRFILFFSAVNYEQTVTET